MIALVMSVGGMASSQFEKIHCSQQTLLPGSVFFLDFYMIIVYNNSI